MGKHTGGGSIMMRRTSSMSGMSIDAIDAQLSNTETHQEASEDPMETPHFLRSCRLCNRRLVPGRDIYMYRGDTAFCSLECREEQMKQDERKDKWSKNKVTSKKQQDSPPPSSTKSHQTVAAA